MGVVVHEGAFVDESIELGPRVLVDAFIEVALVLIFYRSERQERETRKRHKKRKRKRRKRDTKEGNRTNKRRKHTAVSAAIGAHGRVCQIPSLACPCVGNPISYTSVDSYKVHNPYLLNH